MRPSADDPPRDDLASRRIMLLLCSQVFLLHAGQQLVVPILPLYASTFGIGTLAIGTMLTLQSAPRPFVSVPAGHLADRLGAHRILLVACVLGAISGLTGALATGYAVLLTSRIIQGIASAISATAGLTYAASLGSPTRSGRRISLYQGSHLLGNSVGPVVGGVLAQAFGYRSPFFAYAAVASVTSLWLWRKLPDPRVTDGRDGRGDTTPAGPRSTLGRRELWSLLGTAGVTMVCFIAFMAAFTRGGTRNFALVLLADLRGVSEGRIGLLLSGIFLANVAVLYLAGMLVDRYGTKLVLVPGWLIMGLGLYMLTWRDGYSLLLGGAILYGLGSGLGNAAPAMYIASVVAPHQRGIALGLYRTFGDIGSTVGPLLMGWLVVALSITGAITLNAVAVLLAALLFAVVGPSGRKA